MEVAEKFGMKVQYERLAPGVYGATDHTNKIIVLATEDHDIFFHELGHTIHRTFEPKSGHGQEPEASRMFALYSEGTFDMLLVTTRSKGETSCLRIASTYFPTISRHSGMRAFASSTELAFASSVRISIWHFAKRIVCRAALPPSLLSSARCSWRPKNLSDAGRMGWFGEKEAGQ